MNSDTYTRVLLAVFLLPFIFAAQGVADAGNPFFANTNMVRDVFGEKHFEDEANRELSYFAPIPTKDEEEEQNAQSPEQSTNAKDKKSPQAYAGARSTVSAEEYDINDLGKQARLLKSKEDILKLYGDPNENMPVLARPDAPKPLQAVQQAIEAGDKDLAFAYAKQYVRYIDSINDRARDIAGLVKKVQVAEKIGDFSSKEVTQDEVDEYLAFLEKESDIKDPQVQKLVELAKVHNGEALPAEKTGNPMLPSIRAQRSLDLSGQKDLYFFINTADPQNKDAAMKMAQIYSLIEKREAMNFIALTPETIINQENLAIFKKITGAQYPVIAGAQLVQALGVSKFPTLYLVDRESGASQELNFQSDLKQLEDFVRSKG